MEHTRIVEADPMNDRSPLEPAEPLEPLEPRGSSRHLQRSAGAPAPDGLRRERVCRARGRQRRPEAPHNLKPDWWRTRNSLGVRNWELILIVIVALVAGVAATIGSSIVGVR